MNFPPCAIIVMSKRMLYRNIKDLQYLELLKDKEGLKLTDAGRIAML